MILTVEPETKDAVWDTIHSFPRAAIDVIFWGKCAKGQNYRQSNIHMPLDSGVDLWLKKSLPKITL